MNIDINFFKKLYNDDIIYHYTKASTAIDFIIYNKQLKFNEARKSNDPIESSNVRRRTVYWGDKAHTPLEKNEVQDSNDLQNFASDFETRFYQICFCQNHMGEDFASENYLCKFNGHEEIFGFTKLRMWDQYADKFSGVCIALSKEKILSLNRDKLELIEDDVQYFTFKKLSEKKLGDIQGNYLANIGKEKYQKQIEEIVKKSFFYKHIDYSGENEYRIGTLYDKKNCCVEKVRGEFVFDKSIMLDISDCIEAIFMSSYANNKQKSELLEYAEKMDIPLIEMQWHHDSFKPIDYRKWMKFMEELQKNNKS